MTGILVRAACFVAIIVLGVFLRRGTENEKTAARRVQMEIDLVSDPDEEDDDHKLNQDTQEQIEQIRAEQDQMVVVVIVDVHDLQLEIGHKIRNDRSRKQC